MVNCVSQVIQNLLSNIDSFLKIHPNTSLLSEKKVKLPKILNIDLFSLQLFSILQSFIEGISSYFPGCVTFLVFQRKLLSKRRSNHSINSSHAILVRKIYMKIHNKSCFTLLFMLIAFEINNFSVLLKNLHWQKKCHIDLISKI